jgi:hypothetical protein
MTRRPMTRPVTRRLSARDRSFLPTDVAKVIGPLDGVHARDLRRALADVYADRPDAKAVSRLDRPAGRWRPVRGPAVANWIDNLVLDLDPSDDADKVAARLMSEPLRDRPLLLAAGGPYAGMRLNHATGDGRLGDPLFSELLHAAVGGRRARHPYPGSVRLPLLRAVVRHLTRHPGRLPSALTFRRPPALSRPGDPHLPWAPALAHHWASSGESGADRLRRWRDEHVPGVSVGAVLFAAAAASFARHVDAVPRPGMVVLMDARRYLPPGTRVDGNFASGQYVEPRDPADPRAVHEVLADEIRSGRSLTMLALHNARQTLVGHRYTAPVTAPAAPRPRLSLTYLGRTDVYADLPWSGPETDRRMIDVVGTAGPEGVTVAIEEIGGVLHATSTFHANVFDAGQVAAATEALIRDTAGLLQP